MLFLKRYLRIVLYGLLLTPLLHSTLFSSPYVFVQVHYVQALASLIVVPLSFLLIFSPESRRKLQMISFSFVGFVLGLALLNSMSINPRLSYFGVWERFGSVLDWASL